MYYRPKGTSGTIRAVVQFIYLKQASENLHYGARWYQITLSPSGANPGVVEEVLLKKEVWEALERGVDAGGFLINP